MRIKSLRVANPSDHLLLPQPPEGSQFLTCLISWDQELNSWSPCLLKTVIFYLKWGYRARRDATESARADVVFDMAWSEYLVTRGVDFEGWRG